MASLLGLSALVLSTLPVVLTSMAASAAPDDSDSIWAPSSARLSAERGDAPRRVNPSDFGGYTLNDAALDAVLDAAPAEKSDARPVTLSVPAPNGELVEFAVTESPIMQAGLAAAHPEITTYAGRAVEDGRTTIRLDKTPMGFHASVRGPGASWYVDPAYNGDDSLYLSYLGEDVPRSEKGLIEPEGIEAPADEHAHEEEAGKAPRAGEAPGAEVTRRTYRLALLTDPSYAQYFGSQNVLAEKVTLMNRVNQIYNDDMAIRLVLIDDTEKLNLDSDAVAYGTNGPCGGGACFTTSQIANGCGSALLTRTRLVIGQLVGADKYDIGHIMLGINGGGIASLNAVGGDGKARGCTGLPQPEGDFMAIDYVAHEMGHQFGGNHTFNGTQHNCGGNKAAPSVEPGSGSSVMAYAGICRSDNLQPHTDPYFSQWTQNEFTAYITSNRNPINEVHTVGLKGFDTDGESFTLTVNGMTTEPIVRGVNYSQTGIDTAIETALADGGTPGTRVTIAAFFASGTVNDNGFQVTYGGAPLGGTDLPTIVVNPGEGADFTPVVGVTADGGPIENMGWKLETLGNHAPEVTAPAGKTIPMRTPFTLTGSGSDADGDDLIYLWEQADRGAGTGTGLLDPVKTNGPLFRVFGKYADVSPSGTLEYHSPGENIANGVPSRTFPDMEQILANHTNATTGTCPTPTDTDFVNNTPVLPSGGVPAPNTLKNGPVLDCISEWLPTADYVGSTQANNLEPSLNFRFTARDLDPESGGYSFANTKLLIDKTAGPFLVSSYNAPDASVRGGRTQTITWDAAGTNKPELAENVKISLSTDGGQTFEHVLVESTPNDGSAPVTFPNIGTDAARLKIEAVDNYFFDVNNADFAMRPSLVVGTEDDRSAEVQYSDALAEPFAVSVESGSAAAEDLVATATGLPEGLTLEQVESSEEDALPGTATYEVTGEVADEVGTYPATITISDGADQRTLDLVIEVLPEDASVDYTGPEAAEVNQDGDEMLVTAMVTPSDDGTPGEVSTANATFTDSATDEVLCEEAPVAADGTATCAFPADLGGDGARDYVVDVVLGGNYTGASEPADLAVAVDSSAPDTIITSGLEDNGWLLGPATTFDFESSEEDSTFVCTLNGMEQECDESSYTLEKALRQTNVFTVAAVDDAGNVDPTPASRTFTRPLNDRQLDVVKGSWTLGKAAKAYDGTFSATTKKGSALQYEVANAQSVALVVGTAPTFGKVAVLLDGTRIDTIDLSGPRSARKVVTVADFPAGASGPVTMRSTSGKKVRIEGLGVVTAPLTPVS